MTTSSLSLHRTWTAFFAAAAKLREAGFQDILLQFQTSSLAEQFQTNSAIRRAALKDAVKPLGYPFLRFLHNADDLLKIAAGAITEINKYGGICVLPVFDPALLAALMTLRLNIYTDPQKPIQVEPKVYPIGEPRPDSPVFVTTNFSLTYFTVSGEIENSGTSALAGRPGMRGNERAYRLGGGKVFRRFHREIREGGGFGKAGIHARDRHSRLRRPDQR